MSNKMKLAEAIIENDNNMPKGLSECEKYGMTWGCDNECPVFQRGECDLYEGK